VIISKKVLDRAKDPLFSGFLGVKLNSSLS